MSKIYNELQAFNKFRQEVDRQHSIGFVPTMGALHAGHLSLLKKSKSENDLTILSIFINPTQFNNPEDLKAYPSNLENDLDLARAVACDVILIPEYSEIYSDNYRFKLSEDESSSILCGAHRPGHFSGVLTIVLKLLNIVNANRAYFGKKDYQQFKLIEDMAKSLFLPTEVIGCETIRELDGLAMSSRNSRLSTSGREKAPQIYKALTQFKTIDQCREYLQSCDIEIEYLEEHYNRRFIAAYIDGVRLIDNVEI